MLAAVAQSGMPHDDAAAEEPGMVSPLRDCKAGPRNEVRVFQAGMALGQAQSMLRAIMPLLCLVHACINH